VGFSFARDKRSAQRIAASYAKESRVVAAIDPANHSYSVLVLAGLFAALASAGAFQP
jgi:hypothetical protein